MKIGEVTGTVVSTQKDEKLIGCKLLIVKVQSGYNSSFEEVVAIDTFGAGVGEKVLLCFGSTAKSVLTNEGAPVDVSVVGIIDSIENS